MIIWTPAGRSTIKFQLPWMGCSYWCAALRPSWVERSWAQKTEQKAWVHRLRQVPVVTPPPRGAAAATATSGDEQLRRLQARRRRRRGGLLLHRVLDALSRIRSRPGRCGDPLSHGAVAGTSGTTWLPHRAGVHADEAVTHEGRWWSQGRGLNLSGTKRKRLLHQHNLCGSSTVTPLSHRPTRPRAPNVGPTSKRPLSRELIRGVRNFTSETLVFPARRAAGASRRDRAGSCPINKQD